MGKVTFSGVRTDPASSKGFVIVGGPSSRQSKQPSREVSKDKEKEEGLSLELSSLSEVNDLVEESMEQGSTRAITGASDF